MSYVKYTEISKKRVNILALRINLHGIFSHLKLPAKLDFHYFESSVQNHTPLKLEKKQDTVAMIAADWLFEIFGANTYWKDIYHQAMDGNGLLQLVPVNIKTLIVLYCVDKTTPRWKMQTYSCSAQQRNRTVRGSFQQAFSRLTKKLIQLLRLHKLTILFVIHQIRITIPI